MGWTLRIKTRQALLSVLITIPMVFGQFFIWPALPSNAALGVTSFEIGSPEEALGTGTESADIVTANNGGIDWLSLPAAGTSFDELEVKVLNDQNFVGSAVVMNPAVAASAENCTQENDVIVKGGTKIDDFPFPTVESSPSPGKNDICQVYVSYEFDGGDTIAYIGVVRRETGGTTAVAVELNKVDHANRQVDDLLIMFEFDGSGPVSSLAVRSWNGSTWGDPVPLAANEWGGTSWEYFGEVAVNLSSTGLLPPPVSVDDCDSFSSIAPYGVAGNSNNSNVGDWGGQHPIDIPRCGSIEITKIATPAADSGYEFDWELSDNDGPLTPASGTLVHGQTTTLDIVDNDVFTLAETSADSPYVLDDIVCEDDLGANVEPDAISVDVGETVSCSIYNVASAVRVVKAGAGDTSALFDFSVTDNDDFQLSLGGSSNSYLYLPGTTVTIDEDLPISAPAWALTGISCIGSESGDVSPTVDLTAGTATFDTLAGELITCTYSNAQDALLTLQKTVINDSGGGAGDTAWTLNAVGPVSISGSEGDASVTNANVPVGSYDLSESAGPDGYTMVGWSCGDHGMDDADTVTLAAGDIVTCTVTNDDIAPLLTLEKVVLTDDGGGAVDTDWTLFADGPDSIQGSEGDASITGAAVEAGDYDLSESDIDGYVQLGSWDCGQATMVDGNTVTLNVGDDVTCTVTNDDVAGSMTVIKVVEPAAAADPDDFALTITPDSGAPIPTVSGDTQLLGAGTYTIGETLPEGFQQISLTCMEGQDEVGHPVALGLDQHVTCTIVNGESPTVTVVKATQPESSDLFSFTLSPGDTQEVAGNGGSYTWEGLAPGDFELTETTPVDWSLETVQCDMEYTEVAAGASFSLDWGDHITCGFTNGELGSITVEKVTDVATNELFDIVIGGGSLDETVRLGNGESETWDLLAPGEYTIDEILVGFNWDISLACEGGSAVIGDEVVSETGKTLSGAITLEFGDHVTCTYTNEQADADLSVTKDDLVDPITLNDDNPVAEIEYEVSVTNLGPAVAIDVVVTDTLPASLTFVSATPSVGSCGHVAGVVTCNLGDISVGDVVTIAIVTQTESLGEVTDLTPENVVEVSSTTPDPDPSNNVDNEVTEIIEVQDIVILPFTGVYGDFWFMMALLLASSGALVLFMSGILKDSDQAIYPG